MAGSQKAARRVSLPRCTRQQSVQATLSPHHLIRRRARPFCQHGRSRCDQLPQTGFVNNPNA